MRRQGFVLFETMLAVAIFAIAVLGLGRCVDNCLRADVMMQQDELARRALENRMAEIEAEAVLVDKPKSEELKGAFEGMTLKQERKPLKWKTEKDEPIVGLYQVDLELSWEYRGATSVRTLMFYVYPQK